MSLRLAITAAALAGLAACGRGAPSTDASLRRDLELARGQGLELAPHRGGQPTLSADELLPNGPHSRKASAKAPPTQPPQQDPQTDTRPSQVAQEKPQPAPDTVVSPAASNRPTASRPAVNPPPPGGYKTMGEIIRKAPFPINP